MCKLIRCSCVSYVSGSTLLKFCMVTSFAISVSQYLCLDEIQCELLLSTSVIWYCFGKQISEWFADNVFHHHLLLKLECLGIRGDCLASLLQAILSM